MGLKLITNSAWRNAVSLAVGNSSSGTQAPTDAYNLTKGARHLRSAVDTNGFGPIYRHNGQKLHADCLVLAGCQPNFGHRMNPTHFQDCAGTFNGGTRIDLNHFDLDDFGRIYARNFPGSDDYLFRANAGLTARFTGDWWLAFWFQWDTGLGSAEFLRRWNGTGNQRGFIINKNTSQRLFFAVSHDGTGESARATMTSGSHTTAAGTWYMVLAYHLDGTEIGLVLFDAAGAPMGSAVTAAHTTGVFDCSSDLQVGGPSADYDGKLWNMLYGTNLSLGPVAIGSHLASQKPLNADLSSGWKAAAGLVSHWELSEAPNYPGGLDSQGSNHLTLSGTVDHWVVSPKTHHSSLSRYKDHWDSFAAGANSCAIVGPKDRTKQAQDLVFFFRSMSADFERSNGEFLHRAAAGVTGCVGATTGASITVGGWFKLESTGINQTFVGRWGNSFNFEVTSGNVPRFQMWSGAATTNATWGSTVTTGTWYFYCAKYDAALDLMYISINAGTPVTAAQSAGFGNSSANDLRVGKYGTSTEVDGLMRGWFFCHQVLSQAEIEFVYNAGLGRDWDELLGYTGLQAKFGSWWPMNEKTGMRMDRGPWANHLSDNNTVLASADVPNLRDGGGLLASQEGFGVLFGGGDGGSYTEDWKKLYFGESLDLGNAEWPVRESPNYTTIKKGDVFYKTERTCTLTFPFLSNDQIDAFKARNTTDPVFVYDADGYHLHEKLWHCVIEAYAIEQTFHDQNTLTLQLQRLRHYEQV